MFEFTNLTDAEFYDLNGYLSPERIERLLAVSTLQPDLLDEVAIGFQPEDFLADLITKMEKLRTKLRGDNRESMGAIIESANDIAQCVFNDCDYFTDELRKAKQLLNQHLTTK